MKEMTKEQLLNLTLRELGLSVDSSNHIIIEDTGVTLMQVGEYDAEPLTIEHARSISMNKQDNRQKMTLTLPENAKYNVAISVNGNLTSNSNDSSNWYEHKEELPKGNWAIYSQGRGSREVVLVLSDEEFDIDLEDENKALKEKCDKLEGLVLNTLQVLGSRNMCPDTVIDLYDSMVDKLKEIKGGE